MRRQWRLAEGWSSHLPPMDAAASADEWTIVPTIAFCARHKLAPFLADHRPSRPVGAEHDDTFYALTRANPAARRSAHSPLWFHLRRGLFLKAASCFYPLGTLAPWPMWWSDSLRASNPLCPPDAFFSREAQSVRGSGYPACLFLLSFLGGTYNTPFFRHTSATARAVNKLN